MAPAKEAPSFDDIIQAGRARARNEALAGEIFGRGRKSSGPQPKDAGRRSAQPGSLASRITPAGVGKRSASSSSFKQNSPLSRPPSATAQKARANRIGASLIADNSQAIVLPSTKSQNISIRGISSGPFYVEASNFARGTTAADIESALLSIGNAASEATLTSCRIIERSPTVIAEMVFTDRTAAEEVINMWNGQKADGRILDVYMKDVAPGIGVRGQAARIAKPQNSPKAALWTEDAKPSPTIKAPKELFSATPAQDTAMDDAIEIDAQKPDVHDSPHKDQRRQEEARAADPDFQDGRYGFAEPAQAEEQHQPGPSREVIEETRQPAYRSNREDRDREYDRDRERDVPFEERRRPNQRNDGYRRNDHGYPSRDSYDRRDDRRDRGPPPPFSNGGGGRGGRGGYGYSSRGDRYGRMYSDDMMRGGRPRGPAAYR